MPENLTKVWKITASKGAGSIDLPSMTTLDAITRQLPQGYYSTFRTFDNRKRALDIASHLQRLYKPADMQNIRVVVDANTLRKHLRGVLHDYSGEVRARIIMTKQGQIYIAVEPLKLPPPEIYMEGVKVVTTDAQRDNPRLKSTTFISASEKERAELSRSNIYEALLVRNGSIVEGMTSNFFYFKDDKLNTARRNILLGVTRRIVLRVARGSDLDILYRPLKREQIQTLSESFITSSSRGIVPVVQIDKFSVGEGIPGPITRTLMAGYAGYVKTHAEMI